MYGQSVHQKTMHAKYDNEGQYSGYNPYAVNSPTVQPLDFTLPRKVTAVPSPHRETKETSRKLSQIFTVQSGVDSSDPHQL